MKTRTEIDNEADNLRRLFEKLDNKKLYENASLVQAALVALEWALSDEFKPVSKLEFLQPK